MKIHVFFFIENSMIVLEHSKFFFFKKNYVRNFLKNRNHPSRGRCIGPLFIEVIKRLPKEHVLSEGGLGAAAESAAAGTIRPSGAGGLSAQGGPLTRVLSLTLITPTAGPITS